jgi:hypothetical protein
MGFVLGLHGPAKAGKDSIADYLIDEHSWGEKLSFAANLKQMCRDIFFLSESDVDSQEGKEKLFPTPKVFTQRNFASVCYWMSRTHKNYPIPKEGKAKVESLIGTELETPRRILQFVGTDICRELIPSYHQDIVAHLIEKAPDRNYVITDIRFPNEGDFVLDDLKGCVIEVVRPAPGQENIDRTHPSETAMKDWGRFTDVVDNNKDGLQMLYVEVDNLLKRQNLCQETQSSSGQKTASSLTEETGAQSDIRTTKLTGSINAVSE